MSSSTKIRFNYDKALDHVNKRKWELLETFNKIAAETFGESIQCKGVGCIGCCYQMVAAHLFEGVTIAKNLLKRKRLRELAATIRKGGEQTDIYDGLPIGVKADGTKSVTAQWMAREERCTLLNSDDKCIVYGVRPVACAAYMVVTDPKLCYPPPKQEVCSIDSTQVVNVTFELDRWFITQIFGEDLGLPAIYPLGQAVTIGALLLTDGPNAVGIKAAEIES